MWTFESLVLAGTENHIKNSDATQVNIDGSEYSFLPIVGKVNRIWIVSHKCHIVSQSSMINVNDLNPYTYLHNHRAKLYRLAVTAE